MFQILKIILRVEIKICIFLDYEITYNYYV